MEKKLVEAETKYNAAIHSLRDKQALCDVKQLHIDVCIPSYAFICLADNLTGILPGEQNSFH